MAKAPPREACKIMVARATAASKYREKCKKQKKKNPY
jgi:hypothetical protein